MFKKLSLLFAALGLVLATTANAEADSKSEPNKFSIGLASFATVIAYDTYYGGTDDDSFSGLALFGKIALNDSVALKLLYGKQSFEDDSSLKADSLEGNILLGKGLLSEGFKFYGSLGFYSDELSAPNLESESFSGGMLGAGLGYNWEQVAVDFWFNIRSAGDYEDKIYGSGSNVVAASGGLGLAFRF